MAFTTILQPSDLLPRLSEPDWAVVDCRFYLADPDRAAAEYHAAHIAGAVYAHLDHDLAGPVQPGRTGRHPLPAIDALADTFGRWGIGPGVQVVAYDDAGGALAAARLWWLLRWLGHDAVAVLDGGWAAWRDAGLPVRTGTEARSPRRFTAQPQPADTASADDVARLAADPAGRVLDARGADRFRGENETIDPVAGHIPGARSAPYADNLDADGRFRSPDALRARYAALLGGADPADTVIYCGSGVTAAHDVLAMQFAGLAGAKLYAGSWSEWITLPSRPVATGTEKPDESGGMIGAQQGSP
jgi:thiosulfate/3-mercaptopyruvate sulfurtransferase